MTVITSSLTTAGDNLTLAQNEDLFIAAGVTRASSGGKGIAALFDSHVIDILGTVYGDTVGLDLGLSTASTTFSLVTIGSTGSVISHLDAIKTRGSLIKFTNDGYIKGNRGLEHEGGHSFDFVNNGTVVATFGTAVSVDSVDGRIVNYGTIVSQTSGRGVELVNSAGFGSAPTLDNYGTIVGSTGAIVGFNSGNAIRNFGEINGDIDLGSGADMVLNTGRIVGDIALSSGIDRYDGRTGQLFGTVSGGGGDDTILTGNEDDTISGGSDVDTMAGGNGDDTYFVDNSSDKVIETAGGGNDKVQSTASLVLGANVETLVLTGVATINGIGNAIGNVIIGNTAANTLDGGIGNDNLNGDAGNDKLFGSAGNDVLNGGIGNDTLFGGAGIDTLTGGANLDIFVFNTAPNAATNRDIVTDFSHADDTFQLENAIFTKLGAGAGAHQLNPAFFRAGTAALDANDYLVYNKVSGVLYYDPNGNAAGGAIAIAALANKPVLAANDFVVI